MPGCGGGDSTTGTAGPQSAEHAQPAEQQVGKESGAPAHGEGRQGLKPTDARSLPNEGTKAVAPGVPTTSGGDNSIQSYGVESNGGERVQAASALKAYLAAQLNGNWTRACSLLAAETREDLERLWAKASGSKSGQACQKAVAGFLEGVPRSEIRALSALHVLSMRVEGDRGFVIYKDGRGTASESPMQREHGQWKVRTLIAKELLISPPTTE